MIETTNSAVAWWTSAFGWSVLGGGDDTAGAVCLPVAAIYCQLLGKDMAL